MSDQHDAERLGQHLQKMQLEIAQMMNAADPNHRRRPGVKVSERNDHELRLQIAMAVIEGFRDGAPQEGWPRDTDDELVLEAMLLAMQMLGGPALTARVVRDSFVMIHD